MTNDSYKKTFRSWQKPEQPLVVWCKDFTHFAHSLLYRDRS